MLGRSGSDNWEGLGRDRNTESSKRKSDDEEMVENSTVPARRESTNSGSACVALVLRARFLCGTVRESLAGGAGERCDLLQVAVANDTRQFTCIRETGTFT